MAVIMLLNIRGFFNNKASLPKGEKNKNKQQQKKLHQPLKL